MLAAIRSGRCQLRRNESPGIRCRQSFRLVVMGGVGRVEMLFDTEQPEPRWPGRRLRVVVDGSGEGMNRFGRFSLAVARVYGRTQVGAQNAPVSLVVPNGN